MATWIDKNMEGEFQAQIDALAEGETYQVQDRDWWITNHCPGFMFDNAPSKTPLNETNPKCNEPITNYHVCRKCWMEPCIDGS